MRQRCFETSQILYSLAQAPVLEKWTVGIVVSTRKMFTVISSK